MLVEVVLEHKRVTRCVQAFLGLTNFCTIYGDQLVVVLGVWRRFRVWILLVLAFCRDDDDPLAQVLRARFLYCIHNQSAVRVRFARQHAFLKGIMRGAGSCRVPDLVRLASSCSA